MARLIDRNEATRRLAVLQLPEEAHRLIAEPRFWHEAVVRELFELSDEWVVVEPRKARALAGIISKLVDLVPPEHCQGGRIWALKAMSLCVYGTAARSVGEFSEADASYLLAGHYLSRQGRQLEWAELWLRQSTLQGFRKNFDEAIRLADKAVNGWKLFSDDQHMLGRALLNRSDILSHAGRSAESLRDLGAAMSHLDFKRCPRLYYVALHNHSVTLLHKSSCRQDLLDSAAALEKAKSGLCWDQSSLPCIKILWIEGMILAGLGRGPEGLTRLRESFVGLKRHGANGDLILLALDIAALLEKIGDDAGLKQHGAAMFPLMAVARENTGAYAALLCFQRAVSRGAVTSALITDVRRQIEASGLAA